MRRVAIVVALAGCNSILGIHGFTGDASGDGGPSARAWLAVAAGATHTCAIADDGALWCWGRNDGGALGLGATIAEVDAPALVDPGMWAEVSASTGHSCALQIDHSLWCWGQVTQGNIPLPGNNPATRPTRVPGAWLHVATGDLQTCAIADDQSLWCSGSNVSGQLLSNPNPQSALIELDPGPWRAIATSFATVCGIRADDTLWCWGSNSFGETGGPALSSQSMMLEVDHAEAPWRAIAMSSFTSCAITASNRLRCFGDNRAGQLGDETLNSRAQPMPVDQDAETWSAISLGTASACGITTANTTMCWGDNRYDQLANPADATFEFRTKPDLIPGTWSTVAIGLAHVCAIDATTHALACAGNGGSGQLGDGLGSVTSPLQILQGDVVDAGHSTTCAIASGALSCWGYNGVGAVGDNTYRDRMAPVALGTTTWSAVSVGAHTCAIDGSHALWCWGSDDFFELGLGDAQANQPTPQLVPGNITWTAIASSDRHSCGVALDGTMYCWGANDSGQTGQLGGSPTHLPTALSGSWRAVDTGEVTTCGVTSLGGVECFGSGTFGTLGDGTMTQARSAPAPVVPALDAIEPSVGSYFACAAGPELHCWGFDDRGELGNQSTTGVANPLQVPGTWAHVSSGDHHACGIQADASLWCWGANEHGQLGDGSFIEHHLPTRVGSDTWIAVSAGSDHTCGTRSDHTIWCWGGNLHGQIGNGLAWRAALELVH